MTNHNSNDGINFIIAIALSAAILFGWQFFFRSNKTTSSAIVVNTAQDVDNNGLLVDIRPTSEEVRHKVTNIPKIRINSPVVAGSISLQGARFDDLMLLDYKESLSSDERVTLLAPISTGSTYFGQFGWSCADKTMEMPNNDTVWTADSDELTPAHGVNLTWRNQRGIEFVINVALDDQYMFTITQQMTNTTPQPITTRIYGLINRIYSTTKNDNNNSSISHQGAIGVIDGSLEEYTVEKLKSDGTKKFDQKITEWVGISDKYWLVSIIPDKTLLSEGAFQYTTHRDNNTTDILDKVQVNFLSTPLTVGSNHTLVAKNMFFAGAKKVQLLDNYCTKFNIKLFDRAIDFGWLYIITKPLFYILMFFHDLVGNFGLSIIIVTVIIKTLTFKLTQNSQKSMSKMKNLQPQITNLKTQYGSDKVKFNEKLLALYKTEKINPFSGFLGILIQIPVFFAIYKVLYVTIEMRQAPFYGWIHDLSAPDPTNIFTLFGLLNISLPNFLHLGLWPIIMSISMYAQQQLSPQQSMDPSQAQVMKFLPLIFLFMFAGFPAGLLIYWTWSNFLSIAQQYLFKK